METTGMNSELNDMVRRGQLSKNKIESLVYLKRLVDGYATTRFVSEQEEQRLKERFSVAPSVITWGDYFQTEIASRYFELSDEEFFKVIETIRFDLVSAIQIFQGKSEAFFEKVDGEAMIASSRDEGEIEETDSEALHLQVLMKYYREMGLDGVEIDPVDLNWFDSFLEDERHRAV